MDIYSLKVALDLYCEAICIKVNLNKYCLIPNCLSVNLLFQVEPLFHFPQNDLEEGFKYLGFFLKPNSYIFVDWLWLSKNIEELKSLREALV